MTNSLDGHTEDLLIEQQSKILKGVELRLMMNLWTLKNNRYIAAVGLRKKIVGIYNQAISDATPFMQYPEISNMVGNVKTAYKKYDNKYRKEIPAMSYRTDKYGLN
jgi:hypothetical protein